MEGWITNPTKLFGWVKKILQLNPTRPMYIPTYYYYISFVLILRNLGCIWLVICNT